MENNITTFLPNSKKTNFRNERYLKPTFYTQESLEAVCVKENKIPMANFISPQRIHMKASQEDSQVPILNPDKDVVATSLTYHMLENSSCINMARGTKLKVERKFKYQNEIYTFYRLNDGKLEYIISNGFYVHNGYASIEYSDLSLLNEGDEIEINSDESDTFYLSHINSFDPVTRVVSQNIVANTVFTNNADDANDSICISKSFAKKCTTLKHRTIIIDLDGSKQIISKYPKLFPDLNEVIDDEILCKIVTNESGMISLIYKDGRISVGEDNTKLVEPNSFIGSIKVYAGDDISNTIDKHEWLVYYRDSLREFRQSIYEYLVNFDENDMSRQVMQLKENFKYDTFIVGEKIIDAPYIILEVYTRCELKIGSKISNNAGGKGTVQHIYEDGYCIDEYGRNIDLIYPLQSPIARNNPSVQFEQMMGAISLFIDTLIKGNKITVEELYKTCYLIYDKIGVKLEFEELMKNITKEDLYEHIKIDGMRFIIPPMSNTISLGSLNEITEYLENKFNFGYTRVFTKTRPEGKPYEDIEFNKLGNQFKEELDNEIKNISNELTSIMTNEERSEIYGFDFDNYISKYYTPKTSKLLVGKLGNMLLLHDIYHSSSAIGVGEVSTKGYMIENNNSKKVSESPFKEGPCKVDVQAMSQLLNQTPLTVARAFLKEGDDNVQFSVKEKTAAIGMDMKFLKETDMIAKDEEEEEI